MKKIYLFVSVLVIPTKEKLKNWPINLLRHLMMVTRLQFMSCYLLLKRVRIYQY